MTDYSSCFSQYFRAEDLRDGPRTVTVKSHGKETMKGRDGGPDETKVVLRFNEDDRGVTLNATRFADAVEIFGGKDADKWVGQRLQLVYDPTVRNPKGGKGAVAFRSASSK